MASKIAQLPHLKAAKLSFLNSEHQHEVSKSYSWKLKIKKQKEIGPAQKDALTSKIFRSVKITVK